MDVLTPQYDDRRLLDVFDRYKRESMEHRWVYEREWLRDIYYVLNRQWIFFHPTRREWVDKRLQKWVPRPVTNKMAETVQAIRTTMSAIKMGVIARPVGHDTQSVSAAEVADRLAPLIHDEHNMDSVLREADFWFIVTGNALLQLSWDRDHRFNATFIPHEQCTLCGNVFPPQVIVQNNQACPIDGNTQFIKAIGPDNAPIGETIIGGRGRTNALSPFEYTFAPNITRFDELPYLIRLRWRDKDYYEANNPEYSRLISWEKSPSDRSLQIYKSLALSNDVGTSSQFSYLGSGGADTVEGVTEYELWLRPTPEFPSGLVLRVAGDKNPMLVKIQDEGIPGEFPYKDINGHPLFPFAHAAYEHVGGRLLGRSAISPLIQKQDQLNQLDSLVQLIIQRMANPVWVVPENAGIEHFTGEPGLVMKWNPVAAGGNAKPERIAGENVPASLFTLREQILRDIEELSGTYDVIKGQKPAGVEAFSALQLLVERSQSRFTSAFNARGEMYRSWFQNALELERQYGPQERTWAVMGPNKGYTFSHFQNAQLQGNISIQVEDGSNVPKTSLGERASIEQANQLKVIDPSDPDQRHAILTKFGLTSLVPSLNVHVQSALQVQDEFEKWTQNPQGPPPLVIKPWHNLQIHFQERIKWLNSDKMREIMQMNPMFEQIVVQHLGELQMMLAPPAPVDPKTGKPVEGGDQPPQGGALALAGSNRESGSPSDVPRGTNQGPPNTMGPV